MRIFVLALFLAMISASPALASVCDDWNTLDKEIRDGKIDRKEAKRKIIELDKLLLEEYTGKIGNSPFFFPIKGYGRKSAGDTRGSSYKPAGYNFYDGNRHGGHPAHDLFIRDRGRTGLDDRTGKPAEIVAFADGVVVAVNPSWEYPNGIRGGIYIWIFNPESNRYYYYAHLAKILVAPGDIVKAGDTIALLGRTGKNAYPKRSPTHIHFMCLSFDGGAMKPVNTWRELPDDGKSRPVAADRKESATRE
ncbi:MAG TPA: M23 family metallopeptidase [Geobacteraceae bacterium]|nr:M23 family metallopeptidase [Geobacteraceae bacterium]